MVKETLAELQKAAEEIRDGLKNVNEDIKKLTGRDPTENTRAGNRRIQLKRNSFQHGARPEISAAKQRRESDTTGTRRWGRTVEVGSRISIDEQKLESSGDEDDSSKPAIQSVIASDLKPARSQSNNLEEDSGVKSRNRRMFGFLVGTLQRFKEDTKQKTQGEKKREEIEKKLEEKAAQEKQELISQKRELFQSRREKQHELKCLETKMENAVLKDEVLEHNKHLENFILLKCNPPLFYLPVKHTEETGRLLEETKKTLKDLQNARFKALDFNNDIDLSSPMIRNVDTGKVRDERMKVNEVGHRGLFDKDRDQLVEEKEPEGKRMDEENGLGEEDGQRGETRKLLVGRSDSRERVQAESEESVGSVPLGSITMLTGSKTHINSELNVDQENVRREMSIERNAEEEMNNDLPKRESMEEEVSGVDEQKMESSENVPSISLEEMQHQTSDAHEVSKDTTCFENSRKAAAALQDLANPPSFSIPAVAEGGNLAAQPTNHEDDQAMMEVGF